MSKDSKWKSRLLSSSLPLEYEAAKLLVSRGFGVDSDYSYSRDDSGVVKDFSVDVHGTAYAPFSKRKNLEIQLSLLVECKQRNPNVKWLFFPDPNKGELSPITLG